MLVVGIILVVLSAVIYIGGLYALAPGCAKTLHDADTLTMIGYAAGVLTGVGIMLICTALAGGP